MRTDLNIDSDRVEIDGFRSLVETVTTACERHSIQYFIVGALARDLLLEHVHGISTPRATRDVDNAVAVNGWKQYEDLTSELINSYGYEQRPEPHRLLSIERVLLDIITFGDIEKPPGKVGWPPDEEFIMTTLGFEAAYRSAVELTFDSDLPIRVASLPGVGVLKLIAWSERPYDRKRDAEDFCFILKNYYDVVGDSLYTNHIDLFKVEPFDRNETSARVYGRDVGLLIRLSDPLREKIGEILEVQVRDEEESPLAVSMGAGCMVEYMLRYKCLKAFWTGIQDQISSR